MEAAFEIETPHLNDAEAPALGAVVDRELFQQHHAMGDGVQLKVILLG